MSLENKIKESAATKFRVHVTRRKRCKHGFKIIGTDGTCTVLPSKRIALQFLLAIVRYQPVTSFHLKPALLKTKTPQQKIKP